MARELPIPSDIALTATRIRDWARMAARSYGFYAGINEAIKAAPDRSLSAVHMGDVVRNEMAILSAIRVHALLDRDADASLQAANRYLQQADSFDRILNVYTGNDAPEFRAHAMKTCDKAIADFRADYAKLDWKAFGKLQAFRNGAIAHISIEEVRAALTYDQLEHLVRLSARLSSHLSLMTSGLNSFPEEEIRDHYDDCRRFWGDIFTSAADRTVGHYLAGETT